ncbi:(d)CMP kinase [Atopobacter sp. AH10]|uniref:(d)CMP kinase n=1 Tax=Atopobacter sp. AH10 TaxID=2315861 RepID=UPI000EF22BEB|nr:(d)CMP kinase [Atopobacter sp. AH10]RLK63211.1 (d)CMP kinase [Atopobacter sp. AH10]
MNIAIDGPASSGKSTIAKKLAKEFGLTYLDTGAMYRSLTYLVLSHGLSKDDIQAIVELAKTTPCEFKKGEEGQEVWLNGENVTLAIRGPEVTANVSEISAIPEVRQVLVDQQRAYIGRGRVIMDGRDIGTVVMPNADVKIFLTASAKERAKRRFKENQEKGLPADYEAIYQQILERDYYDSHREHSPLKKAEDAVSIDTSTIGIDQVLDKIRQIIHEKG